MQAVTDVSLALARGETLGLVGESGCGKTTLAKALVGLESSTGTVSLNGEPLPVKRTREQARRIQTGNLESNHEASDRADVIAYLRTLK